MHLHSHGVGFLGKRAELAAARRLFQPLAAAEDSEGQVTAFH